MDIWGVVEYTAAVTIVGLLIWLVKMIFHDKLDARWHYFIWLVVLVRIVVPVRFQLIPTPLSVFQEIPLKKWIEMGRLLAEKRGYSDLAAMFGRVYLLGAVLWSIFYLLTWICLRVRLARAPRADVAARSYVDSVAEKYGLKSCREIRMQRSSTPYICGVLYPILVLPMGEELPAESVIVHELLHKKWKDVLVNITIHIVRVVNWFNPVIWFLTAMALNDSEALCDQRVLEYCGEENMRNYGELLIAMGERRRKEPFEGHIRAGTSNMASSYRNMRVRICRIRDFRRMPGKLGLVTFCITLMLALAGIGSVAEESNYFEIPQIESGKDLEWALLYARCYHARTPEEAVYLFLRACEEQSTVYRMAVMPKEEIEAFEKFAQEWFINTDILSFAELGEEYPVYFPGETDRIEDYRVYNLLYDEKEGSATVCAIPNGKRGNLSVEWKLALIREDGWKVWLLEEIKGIEGEYQPEPLLSGSVRLGDFLVELHNYNEGYFDSLRANKGLTFYAGGSEAKEDFPSYFSTEYRYSELFVTYLGVKSLKGYVVNVEAAGIGQNGSDESGRGVFDGEELMEREPLRVYGHGNGFTQPGWCWMADDRMGAQIRIYIDGRLLEEGEIWSEKH